MKSELTRERISTLYNYDPATGTLTHRTWGKGRFPGKVIGAETRGLLIDRVLIKKTHVIWFIVYGRWPSKLIDHINKIDTDDRIINLREATTSENATNSKRFNPHGLKGVTFCPERKSKQWAAQIRINGKKVLLGRFLTKEEAHAKWLEAATNHHGEFMSAVTYT